MKIKTRQDLIKLYIDFFKSKNHKEIPSASLIPINDPTVLFTTAGMHPLVPFLLGGKHALGKRLVNVQKCIRTGDIDEVGDEVHHTFFEMLGNWSLGDYSKEEAIKYTFEFHNKILGIPKEKYGVTCFGGDKRIPQLPIDKESAEIWQSLGIPKERIAFLEGGVFESEKNWWGPAGAAGPCGPDTEQFYYTGKKAPKKFDPNDKKWVEIGNDVIMEYVKDEKGNYNEAEQKNIDFGGGVERTLAVLNRLEDNYKSSVFELIIEKIEKISNKKYGKDKGETRAMRIIADHLKAATFIIADGISPGNVERGYVLRRLIRRAIRYGRELGIKENFTADIASPVLEIYPDYPELKNNKDIILIKLDEEENKFNKTLEEGLRAAEKVLEQKKPIQRNKFVKLMQLENKEDILKNLWKKKANRENYAIKEVKISEKEIDDATITGQEGFLLYQSHGFPVEMILDLAREKNLLFHRGEFKRELEKHQELSRTSSSGKFKSGLADNSDKTKKLHTSTHLLNEALRKVLSKDIRQKGSNITPERLRFDFNFSRKLTGEEVKKIEDEVNRIIKLSLKVMREEMPLKEAIKSGAQSEFGAKYPEIVSVYTIGNKDSWYSREICTGPHVENTKEIGKFKIIKEESVAAGIRRIKAIVE